MKLLTLATCCTLLLSACSSTPKSLIIAPELITSANEQAYSAIYNNKIAAIDVQDLRANRHILQILRSNKAAEIINSAQEIKAVIKKSLTQILTRQGLTLSDNSTQKIHLFIDSALINVQQSLVKYNANNEIVLRIEIQDQDKTLNKVFRSHGKSNGPLTADLAVLERDFNQQLAQLINQIVNDKEVQQFIKQL